jgi:hypothetical protein
MFHLPSIDKEARKTTGRRFAITPIRIHWCLAATRHLPSGHDVRDRQQHVRSTRGINNSTARMVGAGLRHLCHNATKWLRALS